MRSSGDKMVAGCAAIAMMLLSSACATSRSTFEETLADGSSTHFETKVQATIGSRIAEGAGNMDYTGPDWKLKVGQSAKGLESYDPASLLQILGILAPLLQPPPAGEPEAGAIMPVPLLTPLPE
jgi:hypothetical protein